MSKTSRMYYMHTLNGRPAYFNEQIVFMMPGQYARNQWLCASLAVIRSQQRRSEEYRTRHGIPYRDNWKYGYVRVYVPAVLT